MRDLDDKHKPLLMVRGDKVGLSSHFYNLSPSEREQYSKLIRAVYLDIAVNPSATQVAEAA